MSSLNYMGNLRNIEVEGHIGTWYSLHKKEYTVDGRKFTAILMEHEKYGGEAAHVIIDENNNVIIEDVFNGYMELNEKIEALPYIKKEGKELLEKVGLSHIETEKVYEILKEKKKKEEIDETELELFELIRDNKYFIL